MIQQRWHNIENDENKDNEHKINNRDDGNPENQEKNTTAYKIYSCPQHKHNNINTPTIQTPDNIENDENQENELKIKNPNIHRTIETLDNIENGEHQENKQKINNRDDGNPEDKQNKNKYNIQKIRSSSQHVQNSNRNTRPHR